MVKESLENTTVVRLAGIERLDGLTRDERDLVKSLGTGRTVAQIIMRSALPSPVVVGLLTHLVEQGVIVIVEQPQAQPAEPAVPQDSRSCGSLLSAASGIDEETRRGLMALERNLNSRDLFAFLGVPRSADAAAVKQRYYDLCRTFHPDRFAGRVTAEDARRIEEIFSHLTQAQATLTDPDRRARYLAMFPEFAQAGSDAGAASAETSAGQGDAVQGRETTRMETPSNAAREERRERLRRNPLMMRQLQRTQLIRSGREAYLEGNYMLACVHLEAAEKMGVLDAETASWLQAARQQTNRRKV